MTTSARAEGQTNSPVAFLIFNRPDCTRRTFAAIRQARPERLLVVADGPRTDHPGEADLCAAARAIITHGVDWPCHVQEQYSPVNLGCRQRVSSGLDWVFSQVEEAIILEDDCFPHPSFFLYCGELLERYRQNERIMSISGDNFLPEADAGSDSYRFSHVAHIWGWATWKRAWQHYDLSMQGWLDFNRRMKFSDLFGMHDDMIRTWTNMMQEAHDGKVDTWDFQWMFACFARDGLNILPRRNLISNIGFSATATHTQDARSWQAHLPVYAADAPLRHPLDIAADTVADYKTYGMTLGTNTRGSLFQRGKRYVSRRLQQAMAGFQEPA